MLLADWRTLARIIRRSTAVLEVLDARDPQGTRSPRAEHMTKAMEKKLILVINKVDLIPREAVSGWLEYFSSMGLTAVAISSLRGTGKGELLRVMRGVRRGDGDLRRHRLP